MSTPETEEELWFYARHPDDEHWSGGFASREEAVGEAFNGSTNGDVCYVVLGKRPTAEQFAEQVNLHLILDHIIDNSSDYGLLTEDHVLKFDDFDACEAELQAVLARHFVRPHYWYCDGSAAEEVVFNGD